jgi:hypothetical protein
MLLKQMKRGGDDDDDDDENHETHGSWQSSLIHWGIFLIVISSPTFKYFASRFKFVAAIYIPCY